MMLNRHAILEEFSPADFRYGRGMHSVERAVGYTIAAKVRAATGIAPLRFRVADLARATSSAKSVATCGTAGLGMHVSQPRQLLPFRR